MASKTYSAQEMREAADFFVRNAEMVRQKVLSNAILADIHEVVPMLRQAAEVLERCEIALIDFHSCPDERGIINYILRGDAGKNKSSNQQKEC